MPELTSHAHYRRTPMSPCGIYKACRWHREAIQYLGPVLFSLASLIEHPCPELSVYESKLLSTTLYASVRVWAFSKGYSAPVKNTASQVVPVFSLKRAHFRIPSGFGRRPHRNHFGIALQFGTQLDILLDIERSET